MLVERHTFYLKFGKAKDAIAAFKEMMATMPPGGNMRLLTDASGDAYRLISEYEMESFTAMEKEFSEMTGDPAKWRAAYEKFIPFVERSYKEYLNVVKL